MSRYLRMVMLVLAGLVFMIPLLSRPLFARGERMQGPHAMHSHMRPNAHSHQALQAGDDPFSPCAE